MAVSKKIDDLQNSPTVRTPAPYVGGGGGGGAVATVVTGT